MPQRQFHFRPPPGVPQSENVSPLAPPEPTELFKQLGLDEDDPFGESPGSAERIEPAPRMRISAAAATAASSAAAQRGGDSAKSNPLLDKVSIQDWDINPHRILHDLKHQ